MAASQPSSEVEVLANLLDQGEVNRVFTFEQLLYDATGGGDNKEVIPGLTKSQIGAIISSILSVEQIEGLLQEDDGSTRFEQLLYDATGGGDNGAIISELSKEQIASLLSILTPEQVTGLIKEANYQIGLQRVANPAGWIDLDDQEEDDFDYDDDVDGSEQ